MPQEHGQTTLHQVTILKTFKLINYLHHLSLFLLSTSKLELEIGIGGGRLITVLGCIQKDYFYGWDIITFGIVYIFVVLMDEGCKKKLGVVKKLIQQKNHHQALEQLEVMMYKYPKVFQVHLMLGLCYQKQNKDGQAQKAYLQVLDLNHKQSAALKQLCDIYNRRGDVQKGTKCLESMVQLVKKTDNKRYRQTVVKLIDLYEKDLNMDKIQALFQEYSKSQESIGEDFVHIAGAYFRVGTTNQCFTLQKFQVMGVKGEEDLRSVQPAAKEGMNRLLVQIVDYMKAVALNYHLSRRDIANSIMELKLYFPQCANLLMMLLFDQYSIGQMAFSSYLLGQLYLLCQAYFDGTVNPYHNLRYTGPQTFAVCMVLAREYLAFFREFFTLDPIYDVYYPKLMEIQAQLEDIPIRADYKSKIDKFILKQCRELASLSKNQNIESRLQQMKERIQSLDNSYLEEVIARIALNSFKGYEQLNDMKYKLKVRIKQLKEGEESPHLYKYYYDYLIKIARVFKQLDEEIPLREVLEYICKYDTGDSKYGLEFIWFQFGMRARTVEAAKRKQVAVEAIKKIEELFVKLEPVLQSAALRRIIILNVYGGNYELDDQIKRLLLLERSFENLQAAGGYLYWKGKRQESLVLLRQAYRINQGSYHLNRLFFLNLHSNGCTRQALALLEHMLPSFGNIFWINFILANHYTTHHKFIQAESLMIKSLEAFQAGSVDKFRFFFQKAFDMQQFSLLCMVKQNEYEIFFDELVLPEEFFYGQFVVLSNLYFERDVGVSRMRLLMKEGQLLKILGRTKSALNCLQDAYGESKGIELGVGVSRAQMFDHALIRKQYATLLFYSVKLRQSQQMLMTSNIMLKQMLQIQKWPLGLKLYDEVQALFFQISIARLSTMIKFQSQDRISEYLVQFRLNINQPDKPSLTFLKNRYQFHILEFMHQRGSYERVEDSATGFVQHFGLNFKQRAEELFACRVQELEQEDRKFVRECLQDYYIVRGLSDPAKEDQLLQMLSLFPRSSTFCVLYGSVCADVSLKTASFLKVIQLDRQSAISMDILASLYLRQKNYLAATKLFLKSLQTNILNPKCYLGLAICLFCLIVRSVEEGAPSQLQTVRQCLDKISSYMQFIRLNDPFQNYHLLQFLKLLLEDSGNNFQNKLILQSAHKNCMRYRDSLLGELLEKATDYWGDHNWWKGDEQEKIVQKFINKMQGEIYSKVKTTDHQQMVEGLLKRVGVLAGELGKSEGSVGMQIGLKRFQKLLHQLGVSFCLALKSSQRQLTLLDKMIEACLSWQKAFNRWKFSPEELTQLKKKVKTYLFEYLLKGDWDEALVGRINQIFRDINIYSHLVTHNKKVPRLERQIAKQILMNPADQQIRRIFEGYQVVRKGASLRRAKLSYRLQILNNNNLSTVDDTRIYKQLLILYRDPNAILLYLSRQWAKSGIRNQRNVGKWVKLIDHVVKKINIKSHAEVFEKGRRMKMEMMAYLEAQFGVKPNIKVDEYEEEKIKKMVAVFKTVHTIQKKKSVKQDFKVLAGLFKGKTDELDWWILMNLINYTARRVKTSPHFGNLLSSLVERVQGERLKAFSRLIYFLYVANLSPSTEEDLINQIVSMTQLSNDSEGKVSPSTEVIMECTRCYISGSLQEVQSQLMKGAQIIKLSSYSDQILVNFFQLLVQYKSAQSNPNSQGIIDYFRLIADNMLMMIREPLLRGFVLGLKGMIQSLCEGQARSIKWAMLMSPGSVRGLLGYSG